MSKSLGNALDPWEVLDRQGADALRWFMITSGSPWESRRIGHEVLDEIVRQFLLTLWNVYAFFVTYANAEGFDPSEAAPAVADRPALDRWALSQLARHGRTSPATASRRTTPPARAARSQAFVDDLSNWYVRRSRRRFWNPAGGAEDGDDARAAFHTLHTCLVTVAQLLAPFTPFIAEELWRNLAADRDGAPISVHLSDYPVADDDADRRGAGRGDGRRARDRRARPSGPCRDEDADAAAARRRPSCTTPATIGRSQPCLPLVADELNVKQVVFAESDASFGRWRAKPNYKVLGPRLGARVKDVAAALAADDGTVASRARAWRRR